MKRTTRGRESWTAAECGARCSNAYHLVNRSAPSPRTHTRKNRATADALLKFSVGIFMI
jgi:hypothetical protein